MDKPLKILHLEDIESDTELVKRELKKGNIHFDLKWVSNEKDFVSALDQFNPDIILSDHSLPGFNSVEALRIVQAKNKDIPFILVTATISEEFAVSMIKNGAEDYVLKDRLQRLPQAVIAARDRKIAEQENQAYLDEIRKNEKKFRGLIENSNDLIGLFDGDLKMMYRSPNYERITGWNLVDMANMHPLKPVHPDDHMYMVSAVKEVLSSPGNPIAISYRLRHKDGHYLWVEGLITNMLADDAIQGIISNLRDVTEKRSAEVKLRIAHERIIFHLENAPLGFIEWDHKMNLKSWSQRAQRMFGWTENEFTLNQNAGYSFVYKDDAEMVNRINDELTSGAIARNHVIHRNCKKDGSVIWCEWFNSVLKNDSGKVDTIMSLVQDITERKVAEDSLLQSEANLTAIIENTNDFVYSIDREFKYITFNTHLKNVMKLKYGVDISPGVGVYGFFTDDTAKEADEWAAVYSLALSGTAQQFVKNYSTPLEQSYIDFSINPIRKGNNVIGISCFAHDVTEQKKSEEEKSVLVRQLIEHNNDLTQFSYITSHNLRGPVASLLGLLSLINPLEISGESATLIPYLRETAHRLDGIISDISEAVGVRTGDHHIVETVDIRDIIEEISRLLQPQIVESQTHFDLTGLEITHFHTIRIYFHSVLYNLISNAIKFRSPERALVITIKTAEENAGVVMSVGDNGSGIDIHRFGDKIFRLYHRFHLDIDGKGLGLYMVKTQVQALGGTIHVESMPDVGTTFTVRLAKGMGELK